MAAAINQVWTRQWHNWRKHPAVWALVFCAILLTGASYLPRRHIFDSNTSYLPIHTSLEFFSIALSVLIFAIVWHTRSKHLNGRNLFLATCFMGVAVLDYFHALSYPGMPDLVTVSSPDKTLIYWLAARLMAVTALLGTTLFAWDVLKLSIWRWLLFLAVSSLVLFIIWSQLFHPEVFPQTFVIHKGLTVFKVRTEYVISALCLLTAGLMFYRSEQGINTYWVYLGCAVLIMMFSEIYFTLYATFTDTYNFIGHIYKVIAYGMIYRAVFITSVLDPYQQIRKLQESQQKTAHQLQEAQNISHLGQWELDFSNSKLTWSESIFRLFEIDSSLHGATYEDFIAMCHPDDRQKVDDIFTISVRDHAPYEFVHRLLMKDGRVKWVREMGVTEYDPDGNPLRARGVLLEITSIMQMESSLRISEARYRTIAEALPVPLVIYDATGNIAYLNPCFVKTLGYNQADVPHIDQLLACAFPDFDYRESVIQGLQHAATSLHRGAADNTLDVHVVCKDASERDVLVKEILLSNNERLVFFYDITDRKLAEKSAGELREQLTQAVKMEAIGQLTAGIAHDFNNMLAAIVGYTELAQQMLGQNKPEDIDSYLTSVLNASDRAKQLITQMLTFSRRIPVTQGADMPVTAIDPVCREIVSLLRSSIPSSIELTYRMQGDDIRARVQPVNLHQMILNLVVNARDAIDEYGKIDILVARLVNERHICASCKHSFQGDFVTIRIQDNGSGITNLALNKIFDPFFTTKAVGKGTGMGLSVVHGLAHSAGGHILVESDTGEGSVMQILLPLEKSVRVEDKKIPILPANQKIDGQLSGIHIMVVDDEQSMLKLLRDFLSIYGAQVQTFNDSRHALETFANNQDKIDLVITDETMPGMTGMHLAEIMLKLKPSLPVILCTGYSEHAYSESAAAIGIAGFFQKPVKINELLLKILDVLPGNNSDRPG